MNQQLALQVLGAIMDWDDQRCRTEFAWVRLMSRIKYDGYQDYLAGARFTESLANWLQQFELGERATAYDFVRAALTYVSAAEMRHLVELVYPATIEAFLIRVVAERLAIPAYAVWSRPEAVELFGRLLRKSLFLGLSDGSRIDTFRRANAGVIGNEQVVVATQLEQDKWDSLLDDLQTDLGVKERFSFVFLLDDFIATGTTLMRREPKTGKWKGKLPRFRRTIGPVLASHFDPGMTVVVHHYLGTHQASVNVAARNSEIARNPGPDGWFADVRFTHGLTLPENLPVDERTYPEFMALVGSYYDPMVETSHTDLGGGDVRRGFGGSSLPLVLDHNTPNNSVALLWADTDGAGGTHAMRPLFRRRQRHS